MVKATIKETGKFRLLTYTRKGESQVLPLLTKYGAFSEEGGLTQTSSGVEGDAESVAYYEDLIRMQREVDMLVDRARSESDYSGPALETGIAFCLDQDKSFAGLQQAAASLKKFFGLTWGTENE